MRHIADIGHGAATGADRHIVQIVDLIRAGVELDEVLERAHFLRARRQDEVLSADGVDHVVRGQAVRAQRLRIEIHLHLALLAAERKGYGRTGDGGQLSAQDSIAEIVDLRLGQAIAG
jgi:hypothetical protein